MNFAPDTLEWIFASRKSPQSPRFLECSTDHLPRIVNIHISSASAADEKRHISSASAADGERSLALVEDQQLRRRYLERRRTFWYIKDSTELGFYCTFPEATSKSRRMFLVILALTEG